MTTYQPLAIARVNEAQKALARANSSECHRARRLLRLAMLRAARVGVTPWSGDELLAAMEPETDEEREELDAMGKP